MPNNICASPSLDKETRFNMDRDGMRMAKRNRGKTISYLPSNGRGTCPLCERTRIKLLYSHKTETNQTIKVCKYCRDKKY
ncbi:MAG: hypothetical protein ACJ8GL_03970, partial [Bacillus sp. (in: firmicutes)]